jgi:voltage-gated potassium channel
MQLRSRAERRRLFLFAILRILLTVAGLLTIYFTVPLNQAPGPASVIVLTAGLLLVAVVLGFQIRATMRSPNPRLRAVESIGASAPFFVLLFALAHYLLDLNQPGSYSEPMTRIDSLYFSVTMFTTVGFGDIAPITGLARVITVVQMIGSLIFLGVVARVLFGAAIDWRGSSPDDTPSP